MSELEPGHNVVIKESGGEFKGTIESVDEDIVIVSRKAGEVRQRTEIDLTDDALEIMARKIAC